MIAEEQLLVAPSASVDPNLVALDLATGVERWRIADGRLNAFEVGPEVLVFRDRLSLARIYGVDRATGTLLWEFEPGGPAFDSVGEGLGFGPSGEVVLQARRYPGMLAI